MKRIDKALRAKVESFDESGMGYWLVIASLRDGRRFSNVCITDSFQLGFPDLCPFDATEIVDVEPDGPRRGRSGTPILLSTDPNR